MQNFLIRLRSATTDKVQSELEETIEAIQDAVDNRTEKEERNACVRASVSRMINLVRDYDSTEGVDDESPNLAAEAANAGRQRFETVERSEQNTELVNIREQCVESQQVEEASLAVLEAGKEIADERRSMTERRTLQSKKAYRYDSASSSTLGADDGSYIRTL